jgi:hypothetical protein
MSHDLIYDLRPRSCTISIQFCALPAESLLNHLLGESTPYQCSFVSKMLNRITYDLLDRAPQLTSLLILQLSIIRRLFHGISNQCTALKSLSLWVLLYVLNTEGLPISARPSEASAGSSRAQFDLLHQKVDSGARAFEFLPAKSTSLISSKIVRLLPLQGCLLSCLVPLAFRPKRSQLQTLRSDLPTAESEL